MIVGHAFTTGKIKRTSIEKVLPNTCVEFAMKDGLGCNASHYLPAELAGKTVPDEHIHEHATCFNLKDRGLVVISSCGHVGIVNSARQAMEVSGVNKVHALVGGFHLGPAPADYLDKVIAEIKTLNPDVIIPMHCSGDNFIQAVRAQMPDKLVLAHDRQPHHVQRLRARRRSEQGRCSPSPLPAASSVAAGGWLLWPQRSSRSPRRPH